MHFINSTICLLSLPNKKKYCWERLKKGKGHFSSAAEKGARGRFALDLDDKPPKGNKEKHYTFCNIEPGLCAIKIVHMKGCDDIKRFAVDSKSVHKTHSF
jgi:hypothetical protein